MITNLDEADFTALNNPEFYAFREQQGRELAAKAKAKAKAKEPSVRSIHLKMADEYAAKVNANESRRGSLRLMVLSYVARK